MADGFAALKQEDTNKDGKVDSLDANWTRLRVWRDLNQDGLSQANELFTLGHLGITGFNTMKTANNQTLANGNQIADLGTYTKSDGSEGTMGDVGKTADVNLAEDTFYREFPDQIPLAEGVAELPEMQGSGKVRDLHEAASQATVLQDLLTQVSQATTRHEQRALIDQLLGAWADTSGMIKTLKERLVPQHPEGVNVNYLAFGDEKHANYLVGHLGDLGYTEKPEWKAMVSAWEQKLHILEAFNGRYFFFDPSENNFSSSGSGPTNGGGGGGGGGGTVVGPLEVRIEFTQQQIDFLNQSYNALRESVYSALVMQTRFKPLLDQIDLVIDDSGIRLDFSQIEQTLASRITQNAQIGLADLIEFNLYAGPMLSGTGWNGISLMEYYLRTVPVTPELQSLYADLGILVNGQPNFSTTGSSARDIIVAGDTTETIHGNGGDDIVFGSGGADSLYGDAGNDTLDGGAGNDAMTGGRGQRHLPIR